MKDREIFEKETGIKEPKLYFVNDDNGLFARAQIAEYWKTYSAWLEKRSEYYQAYICYLLGVMDEMSFMDYCKSISDKPISIEELRNMLAPPDEVKGGEGERS